MIGFELIKPETEDALAVMEWRNDPTTLEMSLTYKKPKTIEVFFPEFLATYFSIKDLPPLFALKDGQRVAALRFDAAEHPDSLSRKSAEISINVAPKWRSKGLGQEILTQVKKWAFQQGYDTLIARIKKGNLPSIAVFSKAGFIFKAEQKEEILLFIAELTELKEEPVFIIAEAGSNWRVRNGDHDLERAYALIEAASTAKADAVKFQLFRASSVYVKNAGTSDYLKGAGLSQEIGELFKEMEMPYEMVPLLAKRCEELGIQFLASAFSIEDFDFLNPFVKMHKIASYEISHVHLLERAAKAKKPLLLSTGASSIDEIDWAVNCFRKFGGENLILMQCTAKYPAEPASMHLNVIPWLKKRYRAKAGLSDHSQNPFTAPISAVALGAKVIEKHFTLSRKLQGPDHAHSLEPNELKEMVQAIRSAELMLGSSFKRVRDEEQELFAFAKRGIQALRDIQPGEILKEGETIAILRPGKKLRGIHPKYLPAIEGKPAKKYIAAGEGIQNGDY